jgi:hypothetical protein
MTNTQPHDAFQTPELVFREWGTNMLRNLFAFQETVFTVSYVKWGWLGGGIPHGMIWD